ncbi:hypothetical protein R1sor_027514 [Riccia sorocarpa]|uniref:Sucrose-phosphate synthase n=1 Tax=Riccia sorocarpa TaxID=122646 RepID=A0ABD3GG38_9MARC
MEVEEAQRMARRHLERPVDEMDLSEGGSELTTIVTTVVEGSKNEDPAEAPSPSLKVEKKLYIVLISLHGLVRGDNMELGRDPDTGEQVKYVVELARALALMPEVYRVDLLTRQICDPSVDWEYGEPVEMLTTGSDGEDSESGDSAGAYIVRIPCGPREKYIRKELLWPYIQEFVDGALAHILNMAQVIGEQIAGGESVWPHVIHGHYADAGDSACLLSGALNVPMVLTGHSLGRNKLNQLLDQGRESQGQINARYRLMRRIEAEELSLDTAELVITSTRQEIEEQWGLYDGFNVKTERALRIRARRGITSHGRYMPRMVVIPPRVDFSNVVVDDVDSLAFANPDGTITTPVAPRAEPPIWSEVMRFFTNPNKPMILALARPDPTKNITTLLQAFGETPALRDLANLTLIMGNRDDIDNMSGGNAEVLVQVFKLIDKYDLYGQVAYPKHHKEPDVPEIYRLAAKTKGVFISPALVEPFGLTLIEAAAHGLPMVATKNGGTVDIQKALSNGILVDPQSPKEISDALLKLVEDRNLWTECRRNGLKSIHLYSWPEHCGTYLSKIAECRMRHPQWQNDNFLDDNYDAESEGDSLRDIPDTSILFSLDDGKLTSTNFKSPAYLLKAIEKYGGKDSTGDSAKALESMKVEPKPDERSPESIRRSTSGMGEKNNGMYYNSKITSLRRRKKLIVIAVDSYDSSGQPNDMALRVIKSAMKAAGDDIGARTTGLILSTALSVKEAVNMLSSGGISVHEFDCLIVSSGSELYYPSTGEDAGPDLHVDADYDSHIDYRWGGEGLRKTLATIFTPEQDGGRKAERAVSEDEERFNSHCLAYKVLRPEQALAVDEVRWPLRQRGLRCHVMYCQNETRMHVIPLLASRSQALRYLFVRWGLDVASMFVIVGETGDTDHEELLSGTHKTLVVKGAVTSGCDKLLRVSSNYARGEVPAEGPYISTAENVDDIGAAMKRFS